MKMNRTNLHEACGMSDPMGRIGITAKVTALLRCSSDIPFAKDVALIIDAESAYRQFASPDTMDAADKMLYGTIALCLEMRFKSILEIFRRSGLSQLLECASGISLRGLQLCTDPELLCVDSELPEVNLEKHALVDEIRRRHGIADHGNYHIVDANVLVFEDLQRLYPLFRPGVPVACTTEGLLGYLTSAELELIAENIGRFLRDFGGEWITSDFALKADAQPANPAGQKYYDAITAATGRAMHAGAFETPAELEDFFRRHGFTVEVYPQTELVPKPSVFGYTPIPPEMLPSLRPLNVWRLRLAA